MEPISAAGSVLGVVSAIASVSSAATTFMRDFQSARKEIIAVKKELSALRGVLEILADDLQDSTKTSYPNGVLERIVVVADNCNKVVVEIGECVQSNEDSRLHWAASGKAKMDRLRRELEVHKSTLSVTLDLLSVIALHDLKSDTGRIKTDTSAILLDTGQIQSDVDRILREISCLQSQLPGLNGGDRPSNYILERFLGDLKSDAETVLGEADYQEESGPLNPSASVQRPEAVSERVGQPIPSKTQLRPNYEQGSVIRHSYNPLRMIRGLFPGHSARDPLDTVDSGGNEVSVPDGTVILTDHQGVRFEFSYRSCKKWKDMRRLISRALNDPLWVRHENYNLIGPNGIILPNVWEDLVKPGLNVELRKWPGYG